MTGDAFLHTFQLLINMQHFHTGIGRVLLGPVERMRLLTQTQQAVYGGNKPRFYSFREIAIVAKEVSKTQGFASFWRGLGAGILGGWLGTIVTDYIDQKCNKALRRKRIGKYSLTQKICQTVIYSVTNSFGQLIFYPLEFISVKMGADVGKTFLEREYRGFNDCVMRMYREGGMRIFFTGFTMKLYFNCLFPLLALGLYEFYTRTYLNPDSWYVTRFLVAESTFVLSYIATYPLLVIKNNLIVETGSKTWWRSLWSDHNAKDTMRRIVKEAGIRAIFAGLGIDIVCGLVGGQFVLFYDLRNRSI